MRRQVITSSPRVVIVITIDSGPDVVGLTLAQGDLHIIWPHEFV